MKVEEIRLKLQEGRNRSLERVLLEISEEAERSYSLYTTFRSEHEEWLIDKLLEEGFVVRKLTWWERFCSHETILVTWKL